MVKQIRENFKKLHLQSGHFSNMKFLSSPSYFRFATESQLNRETNEHFK